jgi:hypothetical protein
MFMTFSFRNKEVVSDWKEQCDKVGYSYSKRMQTLMHEDLNNQVSRTWSKN